jgi:branched-chain amino acid transport system ATP-binding protein
MDTINFVGLYDYRLDMAKNLAHGHQRALGVAIALAADPKLLILDEPVTGMNVEEKETMMGLINRIRERGITVLVVEHDMKVVMGLCDRIAVLNFGMKIAQGTPEEIQKNQDVIEAYLGAEE